MKNHDRSQELRDLIGEGFMKMVPSSSVIGQISEERKRKQEEENERKLAMAEANNYVMQRPEVELPEEVQNMQSITQGNIPEIEPMMNDSRTPAGKLVEDDISEKMAAPQLSNVDHSVTDNKPPVPEDRYSKILAELRAMREGSNEGISAARRADSTNELMSNLNKSFSTIGDALVNRAGITKIKSDPLAIKSNLAEQAEADRKRKLESLMSEYKMISDKEAKDADRKYKQDMLDLQKDKLKGKSSDKLTVGQEALDREFAKEADKYTSSGRVNALSSINKLKEIASDLEKEGDGLFSVGGGRSSILPDVARSGKSVKWRDNAVTSANATLKELFGAQLSDSERESAAKEFYNDMLPNSENAAILRRKIADLEAGLRNKDRKVETFLKEGTLKNYRPTTNSESLGSTVRVQDPKGNIRLIPREHLSTALKNGGKLME